MTPRDEVDLIVNAWHRVRPDLDLGPLEIMSRLTRINRRLDLARRAAFARHDLETWEFDVLAALRRAGRPYALSPGALADQTLVTSGTMTNRIERLVSRGLVTRIPDPADRRGAVVTATQQGLDQVDAALTDLIEVERELLTVLDADQRDTVAAALRVLLKSLK
ncbi:MarR family winged helix-turn-helix transcriptional regulator [Rarobacter incanus]|uniref:MarR family transcriptional regulator n=1 Tax=Rarobacter incanus TaxID=153494 RepID=A0A542SQU2_9MICO|nr:MarR family transcriptional regulator [Rarobacter incanus]TQK76972.1 MarR family transcriptional regulator [Rarobacter incanus]